MLSYLRFLLSIFLLTHLLAGVIVLTAFVWVRIGVTILPSGPAPAASVTPVPIPTIIATGTPGVTMGPASPATTASPVPPDASPSPAAGDVVKIIIPVHGVRAQDLRDTYNDARSAERVHNAIDIMAPRGTPVLATADGEIARLFSSERGGNTIYQFSSDKRLVFYYAHLDRFADGMVAGRRVSQGEVIAYVGDTGNAVAGNYHLHFSIWAVTDPNRYWDGVTINPYPILRNAP
ncbi:MAG: peptidoglycan DD-metalloendopeptidase family protein [Acidobacteria bacterium]|nr:peptidoglycan DD-metalloendopeptidase family protein [Acidobacteriota bacterium]